MKILFNHARILLPDRVLKGYAVVDGRHIQRVEAGDPPGGEAFDRQIDLGEAYLCPGFVELHCHGGGGSDFMDGTLPAFEVACATHLKHGVTTLLPTVLAASREEILRSIRAFREAKAALEGRSLCMPGLHMEGPYLNIAQKGAIDARYIRNPDPEEYECFLREGRGAIARWTMAVELPGAIAFARRLLEEGILPSIGHSNAEYSTVRAAFQNGFTHVTHLYSAMSGMVRRGGFRYPGVIESAFCIPELTVEIIADGCHLPPEILSMVVRAKGITHTALTSDAMRCAGQDVGESILGSLENGQRVIIEDGVAKMPTRDSFAGSIATCDRLVRTMVHQAGISLVDAVRMMTLTPAEILKIHSTKGSIAPGKDADLICLDEDLCVSGVMVEGNGLIGCMK